MAATTTAPYQPKIWTPGDWNAFFGFGTNILVNMLVLTGLLRFVLKMPDAIVFGRILPALDLCLRRVGEIGPVTLARVDDEQPGIARRFEHRLAGRDCAAEQRNIVAERLPEAARLQEIALHVDHHERGAIRRKMVGERPRSRENAHQPCPSM